MFCKFISILGKNTVTKVTKQERGLHNYVYVENEKFREWPSKKDTWVLNKKVTLGELWHGSSHHKLESVEHVNMNNNKWIWSYPLQMERYNYGLEYTVNPQKTCWIYLTWKIRNIFTIYEPIITPRINIPSNFLNNDPPMLCMVKFTSAPSTFESAIDNLTKHSVPGPAKLQW